MITRHLRAVAASATLLMLIAAASTLRAQAPAAPEGEPPPPPAGEPPPPPPGEAAAAPGGQAADRTPPRLSFTQGEVSFWRPGAEDWTPAEINTPLAPGDALYAGAGANLELQIGPRAFVRAGTGTELGLENQEPDFLQLRVPAGHASLDLRSMKAGHAVEFDTPNAAFRIETSGYYRIDIANDTTTFIARRGGHADMIAAGGEVLSVAPSEEVVVQGTDTPRTETYIAPELDAWDRWNYERTDHLLDAVSARYVPPGVYGIDALDHDGTWRTTADYGPLWVPAVAPGWAPYTAGRWIWDPYYGWTWVDAAPWGWAPCHYGRWIHLGGFWGWAPGPFVRAPVYAPALVAFFGGPHFGISIGITAPAVGWVALGWGEPLVPWWGRPGFMGVPWWGGWGGPRVVNNVAIQRTTVVNVHDIKAYQNANVRNAVVAARQDQFGRGAATHVRVPETDLHQLEPLHGRVPVRPVAASLTPREGHATQPPAATRGRSVVTTREPYDPAPSLHAEGLKAASGPVSAPHVVSTSRPPHGASAAPRPPFGQRGTSERRRPPLPPQFGGQHEAQPQDLRRGRVPAEQRPQRQVPSAPPVRQAPLQALPPQPERRGPRAQAAPPVRNLPGEPANRLYGGQGPGMTAPASPGRQPWSARESVPKRSHEKRR